MRFTLVSILLLIPAIMTATIPPSHNRVIPDNLKAQIASIRKEYRQGYWATRLDQRRALRAQMTTRAELTASGPLGVDTVEIPVLLGRYADATEEHSPVEFQQLLFDGPNPSGTITQFYTNNSYGQIYVTGEALGWYQAPRGFNYYVHDGGPSNAGLVYGGRDFTIDIMVASDSLVDYSKYVKYTDSQGRGHVPQLGVVHTGADAAAGADNIWSHRWNIRGELLTRKAAGSDPYFDVNRVTPEGWYITNDLTADGNAVLIDGDYAIEPEMQGSKNTGGKLVQIGVFAHEFGHIFGLPDLYDTDNSSEGLGQWCLMASGSWGGDGAHANYPSDMSAWCKEQLGWITPVVVTSYLKGQTIRDEEDYPEVYKLWTSGSPGSQYFLIENRQKVKSDIYLLNSGLLIFHVDNSQSGNTNENHYQVDLEQADGLRDLNRNVNRGDAGDPFPGSTDNHTFDGYSNPNSMDYLGHQTYVSVANISNSAVTMTADLDVGTRPVISLGKATLLAGDGSDVNSRLEPGGEGSLSIQLANLEPVAGTGFHLRLQAATAGLTFDTTLTLSLAGLTSETLTLPNFIHVDPAFVPREVLINLLAITAQDSFQVVDTAVAGYPSILLVDCDSTSENIARFYYGALDAAGKYYETFHQPGVSAPPPALDKRSLVIVCTGRTTTRVLTDSTQQALTTYVANGGRLFVSGQNVAEDLNGTPFLSRVLHARWSKNIVLTKTVFGVPSDVFGAQIPKLVLSGASGASNQTSPDVLLPDSLAHGALAYGSASGTSCAGIWCIDPATNARVLFFGFGFEAINDSSTGITRQQTMAAILNWFGSTSSVAESGTANVPLVYSLSQNYPNPFNPSTRIEFTTPRQALVELKVYTILGQEVATLMNRILPAGRHAVTLNGASMASGVYFYRIVAGSFTSVRKMLLIR
jgi:M6 family metalloprotease-like protein